MGSAVRRIDLDCVLKQRDCPLDSILILTPEVRVSPHDEVVGAQTAGRFAHRELDFRAANGWMDCAGDLRRDFLSWNSKMSWVAPS